MFQANPNWPATCIVDHHWIGASWCIDSTICTFVKHELHFFQLSKKQLGDFWDQWLYRKNVFSEETTIRKTSTEKKTSVSSFIHSIIHLIIMVIRKIKRMLQQMLPFPFLDPSVSSWFEMPCLRCLWLWIIKVTRKHLWEHNHQHLHCTTRVYTRPIHLIYNDASAQVGLVYYKHRCLNVIAVVSHLM